MAALLFVLLTRRVVLSLGVGVLIGSVAQHGVVSGLPTGVDRYFWANLIDPWHLRICGFALLVLGTIRLTEASNGVASMVGLLKGRLTSARHTKIGTAVAGLVVFFDDYANAFLVGSSMRPLTDRYGVSREKLAYLVDSTAAPVAGVAVVSTWLSYEVGLLGEVTLPLGLEVQGYGLLLLALPLRFYCAFALILVFTTALWDREVGPMLRAERKARQALRGRELMRDPHSLGAEQLDSVSSDGPRYLAINVVVPVAVLVVGVGVGLIYDGGGFADAFDPFTVQSWQALLSRAKNTTVVLLAAAVMAAVTALGLAVSTRQLTTPAAFAALGRGGARGLPALGILFCAWALGGVSKDLGTGPFLVAMLHGSVPALLVPLLTFLAAGAVALATGTSWGTMAILMPAALPLAHQMGGLALLVPTLAAVLDGAIFGDHCSPVSDTTVLSSTACECDLLSHVWTQLPYALLAFGVAAPAYVAVGLGLVPFWALWPLGALAMAGVLWLFGEAVENRGDTRGASAGTMEESQREGR
jgi:Na+/H+ antiporter NhaC